MLKCSIDQVDTSVRNLVTSQINGDVTIYAEANLKSDKSESFNLLKKQNVPLF